MATSVGEGCLEDNGSEAPFGPFASCFPESRHY